MGAAGARGTIASVHSAEHRFCRNSVACIAFLIFKEETMLVLSRKNRETVVIDGCITVKVLHIKGNTIRLGIEAPPELSICRGELLTEPKDVAAEHRGTAPRLEIVDEGPQIISYTCAAS
jgi:carbon storage regulator